MARLDDTIHVEAPQVGSIEPVTLLIAPSVEYGRDRGVQPVEMFMTEESLNWLCCAIAYRHGTGGFASKRVLKRPSAAESSDESCMTARDSSDVPTDDGGEQL